MNEGLAFGQWLKQRRKALDLTQERLSERVGCSLPTVEKIESGERRPSRQIAELLAAVLEIAPDEVPAFVRFARGEHGLEPLAQPVFALDAVGVRLSPPTNLQAQPTPFIGREKEVAAARALLGEEEVRLVTLTGPPGIGKTRLALEVAARLAPGFASGVFFVALGPVSDPALALPTIARTLGVRETRGQPLDETLREYLAGRQLLLVLDNFEQLFEAGPSVARLLPPAPGLKMLITSRTVLHIYGEHTFPVPPMSLPYDEPEAAIEQLSQYEAVRLFVDRARAARPDFALTPENSPSVVKICSWLEGLPLAIELAAPLLRVLPPQALLARLGSRLALLTRGSQNLPPRQQTMRGAIAWSYDSLDPDEMLLFRRLAVFAGGCTLEAAEGVAFGQGYERQRRSGAKTVGGMSVSGGRSESDAGFGSRPPDMVLLDWVSSLADKSLLRQDESGGEVRFWMLETLREYALERLDESGEGDDVRGWHAGIFLELAERAEPELLGSDQGAWFERLEREHDNLRAALSWCLGRGDLLETAARLAGALRRFWYLHGHMSEGRKWLEAVLAKGADLPADLRAKVLHGVGTLAWSQGDYQSARSLFEESLGIWRGLGDKHGVANMLNNLGIVALPLGDYAGAYAMHEESLAIYRELDDKWSIALSLANLGLVALNRGDYEEAGSLLRESLELRRGLGDKQSIAQSLNNLGTILRCQGEYEAAYALHEEGLGIFRELGDRWSLALSLSNQGLVKLNMQDYDQARDLLEESLEMFREQGVKQGIATCLEGLAGVAGESGRKEEAVRLFSAAAALREAIGVPTPPYDRAANQARLAAARKGLSKEAFSRAWEEGERET
jgi:predicted ATPase/Tfp pilus assembly protein PilF/DNA-binding XRE family transcriptional regulator